MKQHIDKFVESNYDKLLGIAKKKISFYKRDVCPYQMVSESYLYVCKNPPEDRNLIPHYMVNWMNLELKFPKSNTNRKNVLDVCVELFDVTNEDKVKSIEDTIDFSMCLESFKKDLDRVDQIIWEVMTEKGLTRFRELSEHFGIPEGTINVYRMRIKKKFREHYNRYYED